VIAAGWAKYIGWQQPDSEQSDRVLVRETGYGKYQNTVVAGRHRLVIDGPIAAGGLDSGPNPYDFLAITLGGCTAMTLRIYAEQCRAQTIEPRPDPGNSGHGKAPAEHVQDCGAAIDRQPGKIDRFERAIAIEGAVDEALRANLSEIAGKCPVHRTLEQRAMIVTNVEKSG
jgi:uncharacterized OsmC-like protein